MKEKHIILKSPTVEGLLLEQARVLADEAGFAVVFKRYFLSDVLQANELPLEKGAVSYIVQPPLDGSGIAVWLYLAGGCEVEYGDSYTTVREGGLEHIWSAGIRSTSRGALSQTKEILEKYGSFLEESGAGLAGNCVRTWFFVHDIDRNYAGMVTARREHFTACGLTPDTHYIASTGICGTPVPRPDPAGSPGASEEPLLVQMDAYAIKGPFTQTYLYAPTHLNPTYEYGVTFERGVKITCSGTSRILISGTASIDNKGQVLHPGDVRRQTLRMWENVEALLTEGGAGWPDVRMMVVYLRDREDYQTVAGMFSAKFPDTPYIILLAPVCRPAWLIEMECISQTAGPVY